MQLRYQYRIKPTAKQRQALARAFGCARVVYNDGLRLREDSFKAGLPFITDGELLRLVTTEAKKTPERLWLTSVSAVVLQQSVADLHRAYRNYQGETWMLDSPEGVCPGQAPFEYPATSVRFSISGRSRSSGPHASRGREHTCGYVGPGSRASITPRRSGSQSTAGFGCCPTDGCGSRRSAMSTSAGRVPSRPSRPASPSLSTVPAAITLPLWWRWPRCPCPSLTARSGSISAFPTSPLYPQVKRSPTRDGCDNGRGRCGVPSATWAARRRGRETTRRPGASWPAST